MSRTSVPANQNLIIYSEQLDNAAWIKRGTCTVTANQAIAPDGTMTADLVEGMNIIGNDFYNGNLNETAIVGSLIPTTPSLWVKKVTATGVLRITHPIGDAYGAFLIDLSLLDTGWNRIHPKHLAIDLTYFNPWISGPLGQVGFLIRANSGGPLSCYIWGLQTVQANWPGTYTKTEATRINTGAIRSIAPGAQNLVSYSEQADNAYWTKSNSSISANQIANPINGAIDADKWVEDATSSIKQLYKLSIVVPANALITQSVFAKNAGRRYLTLYPQSTGGIGGVIFDLVNGTKGTSTGVGYVSSDMVSYGNGWYRCSVTIRTGTNSVAAVSYLGEGTAHAGGYQGDGVSGVYLWGAQVTQANYAGPYAQTVANPLNEGAIRPLVPTSQNLILNSEGFTDYWSATFGSVTATGIADPLGGTGAVVWTPAAINSRISSTTIVTVVGRTYTMSAWAKTAAGGTTSVAFYSDAAPTPFISSNMAVTADWQRSSFTFVAAATTGSTRFFQDMAATQTALHIFGAQMVEANWPGTYVKTPTTGTNVNTGVIRSIVATSQNLLKYSEQLDNAAWTKEAGVVVTANQATAPDGTMTADLVDCTAAVGNKGVYNNAASGISSGYVSSGNTKSIWLKGVLGTEVVRLADPVSTLGLTTCNLTTEWQRFTLTEGVGAQPTYAGVWVLRISGNQFYAWGAQVVKANWAGTYVKTEAAAVNTGSIRNLA